MNDYEKAYQFVMGGNLISLHPNKENYEMEYVENTIIKTKEIKESDSFSFYLIKNAKENFMEDDIPIKDLKAKTPYIDIHGFIVNEKDVKPFLLTKDYLFDKEEELEKINYTFYSSILPLESVMKVQMEDTIKRYIKKLIRIQEPKLIDLFKKDDFYYSGMVSEVFSILPFKEELITKLNQMIELCEDKLAYKGTIYQDLLYASYLLIPNEKIHDRALFLLRYFASFSFFSHVLIQSVDRIALFHECINLYFGEDIFPKYNALTLLCELQEYTGFDFSKELTLLRIITWDSFEEIEDLKNEKDYLDYLEVIKQYGSRLLLERLKMERGN